MCTNGTTSALSTDDWSERKPCSRCKFTWRQRRSALTLGRSRTALTIYGAECTASKYWCGWIFTINLKCVCRKKKSAYEHARHCDTCMTYCSRKGLIFLIIRRDNREREGFVIPVTEGWDEIEAAVYAVVLDVLAVEATLVPEVLLELLVDVVGHRLPAKSGNTRGHSVSEATLHMTF